MTGILAINAFLHSEKYTQQDKLLLAGAKACGINLKIYSNLELRLAVPKADFVLFWDKDVSLAHALEQQGLPVFNSAKAIALCDNKALTYQTLLGTVPQPETMVAPITYFEDSNFSPFIDGAIEHLGLPLVFKECYGSFGAQVFLCHSKEEIKRHNYRPPLPAAKILQRERRARQADRGDRRPVRSRHGAVQPGGLPGQYYQRRPNASLHPHPGGGNAGAGRNGKAGAAVRRGGSAGGRHRVRGQFQRPFGKFEKVHRH